jgi:hypothetical protein
MWQCCQKAVEYATRTGSFVLFWNAHTQSVYNRSVAKCCVESWRLWDAGVAWAQLEPNSGEWHFDVLNKYVDLATKVPSTRYQSGIEGFWPRLTIINSPSSSSVPLTLADH